MNTPGFLQTLSPTPLIDYETVVNLIVKTTTAKGLKVKCRLDRRKYPVRRRFNRRPKATKALSPDRAFCFVGALYPHRKIAHEAPVYFSHAFFA